MKIIVPPLKIQGIKTKLVENIKQNLPDFDGTWIEPFMGSGVVGFNLAPEKAIFSDTNIHIINFYNDIKIKKIDHKICKEYLEHQGNLLLHNSDFYYDVREKFNTTPNSLDFLFLNRACFNGVMRFNKKGKFNTPFCKKENKFSTLHIAKISNQIFDIENKIYNNDWNFFCQHFTKTIDNSSDNDFIYLDPPYIQRHSTYFDVWTESDEEMLYNILSRSKNKFMVSSWKSGGGRTNEYYDKFWSVFNIEEIEYEYIIRKKKNSDNKVIEILIKNY